jgi:hypothetical protein
MSDSTRGIIIGIVIVAVVIGFLSYRRNERPEVGACTRLAGNSSVTVYYRQGDASYATYSSPDCSSQSRITV